MCKLLCGLITPAPPSPLCRSAHLHSPMWSHPATIQHDGPGLRGERVRRHHSCQCHPSETSLTPPVHATLVAPTGNTLPLPLPLEQRRILMTTAMASSTLRPP